MNLKSITFKEKPAYKDLAKEFVAANQTFSQSQVLQEVHLGI